MEQPSFEKFKAEIHRTLISQLDLEKLSRIDSGQARQAVSAMVNEIIRDQRVPLSFYEQQKIHGELLDEVPAGPLDQPVRAVAQPRQGISRLS